MMKLVLGLAFGLGLAGAAAADPVAGTWKTEVDDGSYAHIDMAPCGAAICGKIARTFNAEGEYQSPNLGKTLVIDMMAQGDGYYTGEVWRPSNDKIYFGKITLLGDTLALKGCIAGGLLCSKQTWSRIN
ncbi:DUF2147 domain-containing protein [Parasedimentitalea psychrophila]|uniref:DUF2147 domain-containing protein n=1 Tax=Parasedimentitalea psychrophila TaxID=2997337 RepID=A0A9Y2L4Y3_9RHOB|nr:DUF2147 domain-containing protein [Parasedimentitalea psychrophila]WIY27687.1 DUF2147 domain-containing protein [Parasedimentitalea psychrophila]